MYFLGTTNLLTSQKTILTFHTRWLAWKKV